ncbi:DMT family transporter [Amorphus orientalis]|uniref:Drug/metabolite transporter (DMT)-like permease n=1 Tax=Amorphus orientalis TaxID=649198 RepID=A0AAE4ARJ4_9HYPH|nr:DMT family transporter [Amorphus orientalis]MDQ0313905.1 drug/metabolite transporter (DMT)-like permease [Amorphus orientalis]
MSGSGSAVPPSANLQGIFLMTVTGAMFACLDTTAKFLGQYLPPIEVAWVRFVTHVIFVAILLRLWHNPVVIKTRRPMLQILRGVFMFSTTTLNFAALQYLQLAEAVSIMFAAPLLVTALAGPLLGEHVGPRRWTAVVIGFCGVLVITQPGFEKLHIGVILSLLSMVALAGYTLMTRYLGATETTQGLIFYSGAVGAVGLAPLALPQLQWPEGWLVPLLLATGAFGGFGHFLLIKAHKIATASTLAPFIYTQMLWMILFGYLVFGDVPGPATLIGASIVVGSGLYLLHREHRLRRMGRL